MKKYKRNEIACILGSDNIEFYMADEADAKVKELEAEVTALTAERDRLLAATNSEEEYPGDMPDEMWDAIKGDRDAMTEALRITVRLTKRRIKEKAQARGLRGSLPNGGRVGGMEGGNLR